MAKTHSWEEPSPADLETIVSQLQRRPRGVVGIAARCPFGFPQVIVNRPVMTQGESLQVFPTLFWLTCPYLKQQVSRLESQGLVSEFQDQISQNSDLAREMAAAHHQYAELRMDIVPQAVRTSLAERYPKRFAALESTGIGGIRDWRGVKCLHAHLAHFLATQANPIGSRILDRLKGNTACSSGDCRQEGEGSSDGW